MSPYVENDDGRYIGMMDLAEVGRLRIDLKMWGILYGLVPLEKNKDLSGEINRQIAKANGEGVVLFKISSEPCGLNYVYPLIFLPFWPGCVKVEVSGVIIRRKRIRPN
jgi:hypothetical protein